MDNGQTPTMNANKTLPTPTVDISKPMTSKRQGSLHRALNIGCEERIKTILKPYGTTEITAALTIMNLVRKTRELEPISAHLTPLEASLRIGNLDICKLLLDEGAMSLASNKQKNLLRHAFEGGNLKVCKLLLKAGANIWIEHQSKLPLCFALDNKNCTDDIVKTFVELGFSPNQIVHKSFRQTALHIACKMNHVSIVEYLLSELKVDPNVRDVSGKTPLHFAAENNHDTICEMLVIYGARMDVECLNNFTPLFYMIASGKLAMVRKLLSLGSNIHHQCGQTMSLTPLHFATLLRQLKIVKLLLEREADVDRKVPETGETALHCAARAGCPERKKNISVDCIIQLLIKERANLSVRDKFGWTPLQVAVRSCNTNLAKVLVTNGSQLNDPVEGTVGQQIPFHTVAATCNKDLIKICLEYGADCFTGKDDQLFPAQLALVSIVYHAQNCHDPSCTQSSQGITNACSEVIRLFIQHGFPYELLSKIKFPRSVMHREPCKDLIERQEMLNSGVRQNQLNPVKKAIKEGADVKASSFYLPYPVHFLASKGSSRILSIFLSRGVNVNGLDNKGRTPLHAAAECGNYECCLLLLEHGAVFNPTSAKCPETPLKLAKEKNHTAVVKLLQLIGTHFRILKSEDTCTTLEMVRSFCEPFQSKLNCCDRSGRTLLAIAVDKELKTIAEELIAMRLKITSKKA